MTSWASPSDAARLVPGAADLDQAKLAEGLDAASEVLARLSGARMPEQVVALSHGCPCAGTGGGWWDADAERYYDAAGGRLGGGLDGVAGRSASPYWWRISSDGSGDLGVAWPGCYYGLELPDNPVASVAQVTAHGTVVDPGSYELRNGSTLVRLSGHWPGSLEVRYTTFGTVGRGGQRAAARLGVELARASIGSGACALPSRVTNVARQGVSYTILDPQDFLTGGRTGLYEVDLWLTAMLRPPAPSVGVLSPDLPHFDRSRA